ncbi:PAAR domain-containing protein [Aeromonas hydrophila]|uniref:PAAR domain-containing protein n=1 Tax=Aeromonas hydrophila TaxID=644 RepID=UPI0029DD325D|nr:PAAR domain-containing protein [Aeromonas hydrophila]MDX7778131.1 PAAR domain-containing protein [Aeromonas hydrophila]
MCSTIVSSGDVLIDRDGLLPSLVISVSSERSLGGKLVSRQDEPLAPHDKPNNPPHPRSISGGVGSVLVNGKPIAVTGTAVGCGGVVIGSGSGQAG